ncbi:piggyBac transposable element-derived protein 4-like [Leptopilina heterotoma]|uniref:piggyBac transposable element-derived protein 4-like n=1 Tax=Leptopilina heterotoma TaxID=63436 RepID=UPI001CA7EB88|nr:piggyBac transposable element-derived protein 4-like [Leptopilina heterotoma]
MEFVDVLSDLDSEDGNDLDGNFKNNECSLDENEFNERIERILQRSNENHHQKNHSSTCESVSDDDKSLRERIRDLDGIWVNKTRKHDDIAFNEECGPINISENIQLPSHIFRLFFSDNFIDIIVEQTNLYSEQSDTSFVKTTKEEVLKFIPINIVMGIKRLPAIRDYWSTNPQLHDSFISSIMPVNRFFSILSCLHFNDNSIAPKRNEPGFDKLFKIRPMLTELSENFLKYYNHTKNQSIDESMIKFKGRSTLKQYMPQKPI